VVGRVAARAHHDPVLDLAVVELDVAADLVVEAGLARGHAEAQHRRLTGRPAARALGALEVAAPAIVGRVLTRLAALRAQALEPLGRAEARVGRTALDELLDRGAIALHALRLAIGPEGAAHVGALVPLDPEPAQALQDRALVLRPRALAVGVLDAQHEAPSAPARVGPVEQGGARPADVQVPRGR